MSCLASRQDYSGQPCDRDLKTRPEILGPLITAGPLVNKEVHLQDGRPVVEHDDGSTDSEHLEGRPPAAHWKGVQDNVRQS